MKYIIALFALLFSFNIYALPNCATGSWYDPAKSGEGLNMEVTEDLVVVYLYTYGAMYDDLGYAMAGKQFFVAVGENVEDEDGFVNLRISETIAVPGWPKPQLNVGSAKVAVIDGEMLFSYNLTLDADKLLDPGVAIPWCIGCTRDLVYVKLTNPIQCE